VRNFFDQVVFVPNRTIANVSRFLHGGIDAHADVQIPALAEHDKAVAVVRSVSMGMWGQFGAIILNEPEIKPVELAQGGDWHFIRVHFKIWPGQGDLIKIIFRQQIVSRMQLFQPNYADWQVPVTYRAIKAPRKV
jgi:hypothetical protein